MQSAPRGGAHPGTARALSGRSMSDDWSVGKLDVDAYLSRIGYAGPTEPSEALLHALYRAHLSRVRFENLDIFLHGEVDVSLAAIQDKIEIGRASCRERVFLSV